MSPSAEARAMLPQPSLADYTDLWVALVLWSTFCGVVGFTMGEQHERDRPKPALHRIVVQPANALMQWQCTPGEHREYHGACGARERLGRIKPKG